MWPLNLREGGEGKPLMAMPPKKNNFFAASLTISFEVSILTVHMSLLTLAVVAETEGPLGLAVVDGGRLQGFRAVVDGRAAVHLLRVHRLGVLGHVDWRGLLLVPVLLVVVDRLVAGAAGAGGSEPVAVNQLRYVLGRRGDRNPVTSLLKKI